MSIQHSKLEEDKLNKVKEIFRDNFPVFIVHDPNAKKKLTHLRDLKSDKLGKMVTVRGIVAKCSEVRPIIEVASFICESCMNEILVKVGRDLDPPKVCLSKKCSDNKNRGVIFQNLAMSKFDCI